MVKASDVLRPDVLHRARVLLIEDEVDLLSSLAEYLQLKGHSVDTAQDGRIGLNLALNNDYDVLVLDIGLPYVDGLALCQEVRRSAHSRVGILMLTARDTLQDKLAGLEQGADDYLVKPFALEELELRIRVLARRTVPNRGNVLRFGELCLDEDAGQASRAGKVLVLNPRCFQLLYFLMRQAPNPVGRSELEQALWGDDPPDSDALKVYLHMLRQIVDKPFDRTMIETVRGRGYRLVD